MARFCDDHGVADSAARRTPTPTAGARRAAGESSPSPSRPASAVAVWLDELDLPYTHGAGSGWTTSSSSTRSSCSGHSRSRRAATAPTSSRARGWSRCAQTTGQGRDRGGTVTADRLVVATNMPILDRGAFFARAHPARSYGMAFRTATQAVDGMYLSADAPPFAARRPTATAPAAGRRRRPHHRPRGAGVARLDGCASGPTSASRAPPRPTHGRPRTTCRSTRCPTPGRWCPATTRSWSPAATPSGA